MTEEKEAEYVARIAELKETVQMLNNLWAKERELHSKCMELVIALQKKIVGIKDE